jgi:hypothetical protein
MQSLTENLSLAIEYECGHDATRLEIEIADRVVGLGVGQWIEPETKQLCRVAMCVLEDLFKLILFTQFTSVTVCHEPETSLEKAEFHALWGNGLCGLRWQMENICGSLQSSCDELLETIESRNVQIESVRELFRVSRLMHFLLVTCKFPFVLDLFFLDSFDIFILNDVLHVRTFLGASLFDHNVRNRIVWQASNL